VSALRVLCLDAGSSSLKYALFAQRADGGERVAGGTLPAARTEQLWAATGGEWEPEAIGHRIVLGLDDAGTPAIVTDGVLERLAALRARDPLHLDPQLALVRSARERYPRATHVLCFDTAFFARLPWVARAFPLPSDLPATIRRYGFHGLSYEWTMQVIGAQSGRVAIAHLGSGASLCAVLDGQPLETTLGFGVLGGLMMATRPGDLDPSVLLELMRVGYSRDALVEMLYERSGLRGVSGRTGDMRELLATQATDPAAERAVALFVHQLVKYLGATIAVLGGLDMLVFTGGIGENAPEIRARACAPFAYLGLELDARANARGEPTISTAHSSAAVRIVAADENAMMARHVWWAVHAA
jgi:acetate kinase